MPNDVELFIQHFTNAGNNQNIIETFTCGCCYWFAYILCGRFKNAEMMYDSIINHFVVRIKDRLYDITGDVTDKYNAEPWEDFTDELEKQRIIDYCIEFTKSQDG